MYTLLKNRNPCCNKRIIKTLAYKLFGTRVADRTCHLLCTGLFILYIFTIDAIWMTNIVSTVLNWCFTIIPSTIIGLLARAINLTLLLTISSEVKLLMNAFNCKCD
jgi:uncharacterized membrane protein